MYKVGDTVKYLGGYKNWDKAISTIGVVPIGCEFIVGRYIDDYILPDRDYPKFNLHVDSRAPEQYFNLVQKNTTTFQDYNIPKNCDKCKQPMTLLTLFTTVDRICNNPECGVVIPKRNVILGTFNGWNSIANMINIIDKYPAFVYCKWGASKLIDCIEVAKREDWQSLTDKGRVGVTGSVFLGYSLYHP